MNPSREICFPHPPGIGGPGSFQERFMQSLKDLGWIISLAGSETEPDLVMVVGGTRRLGWLWRMKRKGVPVVLRLDGIAWLHRRGRTGFKRYILAEFQNLARRLIHAYLSDHIIYQSQFVKEWWERSGLRIRSNCSIIHNGVDLNRFKPSPGLNSPVRLVCVEGTIDYSPYALRLLNDLRDRLPDHLPFEIFGRFENMASEQGLHPLIRYHGSVSRDEVPDALQGAILLSLDIHPACPNGVIEALASGAPVVAFDTGSLKELVHNGAGKVVAYGSDPWKLAYPDVDALAGAILDIASDYPAYSGRARKLAEENFNILQVTEKYLSVINEMIINP